MHMADDRRAAAVSNKEHLSAGYPCADDEGDGPVDALVQGQPAAAGRGNLNPLKGRRQPLQVAGRGCVETVKYRFHRSQPATTPLLKQCFNMLEQRSPFNEALIPDDPDGFGSCGVADKPDDLDGRTQRGAGGADREPSIAGAHAIHCPDGESRDLEEPLVPAVTEASFGTARDDDPRAAQVGCDALDDLAQVA